MSISELGSLGEFIGSIAVLATLAYLAIQIRQGAQATRTASELHVTDMIVRWNASAAADREYQRIWDSLAAQAEVSDEDKLHFIWKVGEYCLIAQGVFDQYESRMVSERCWKNLERTVLGFIQFDFVAKWWALRDANYSSAFYDHIDACAKRPNEWAPKSSTTWTQ